MIDDTYNASPASMIGAIDILSSLTKVQRRIAVLADMKELGEEEVKTRIAGHPFSAKRGIGSIPIWYIEKRRCSSFKRFQQYEVRRSGTICMPTSLLIFLMKR